MYGVAAVLREDKPGAAQPMTPDEILTDYAADLLRETGADRARLYAAAREVCISAADEVAYPALWRQSMRAVELCQRAAVMAGPVASRA